MSEVDLRTSDEITCVPRSWYTCRCHKYSGADVFGVLFVLHEQISLLLKLVHVAQNITLCSVIWHSNFFMARYLEEKEIRDREKEEISSPSGSEEVLPSETPTKTKDKKSVSKGRELTSCEMVQRNNSNHWSMISPVPQSCTSSHLLHLIKPVCFPLKGILYFLSVLCWSNSCWTLYYSAENRIMLNILPKPGMSMSLLHWHWH